MSEIDQQFIEYVVKSLVGKPDAVRIDRRIDEKGVLLELTVDPDDLGRVIGKRGATAQSLRTLLRALGTKNDARYNLKIIDNGPPGAQTGDKAAKDQPAASADDNTSADNGKGDAGATDDSASSGGDEAAAAPVEETPKTEEPEPEKSQDSSAEPQREEPASDRLAQTRKELADLDDLDL